VIHLADEPNRKYLALSLSLTRKLEFFRSTRGDEKLREIDSYRSETEGAKSRADALFLETRVSRAL